MTDEVKKVVETLRYCEETGARCGGCPSGMGENGVPICHSSAHIADLIESLAAELERVKRERDAAVEEWKQSAIVGKAMCDTCMFSDDEGRCWNDCIDGELWQWRGVKTDLEVHDET